MLIKLSALKLPVSTLLFIALQGSAVAGGNSVMTTEEFISTVNKKNVEQVEVGVILGYLKATMERAYVDKEWCIPAGSDVSLVSALETVLTFNDKKNKEYGHSIGDLPAAIIIRTALSLEYPCPKK